jgi:ATP-binding cassette, subfamily C (CFTR/MRP), member 1
MGRIDDAQSQPALRDTSLDLRPGQNILVIGRTGSGKSSLLLTLLHILDYDGGRITIDGLDVSRMPREVLRSRIVTIPQDAVELPGSVRFNLGQFAPPGTNDGEAGTDQDMQRALARVGLWDAVVAGGGLEAKLDGVGLSGGQKQLFSLARAILSKQVRTGKAAGVVLLDEPTSSMGDETDVLMRQVVAEEFAGYTIVTVSHRLDAAKDADVIVRMAGGKVVELSRGRG